MKMKNLNRKLVKANTYTERIIQFGEGNFLRAFANWMIHQMNKKANFDGGVVAGLFQAMEKHQDLVVMGQDIACCKKW